MARPQAPTRTADGGDHGRRAARRDLVAGIHALLVATAGRPAELRLLRHARVGDGLPAGRGRDPAPGVPAPARPVRHRRGGRDAPDRVLALRRLPVLHRSPRGRSTPSTRRRTTGRRSSSPRACTPAWTSTSTPSGSRRWSRPSWSPTASSWPATSACSTCAPRRTTSPVPRLHRGGMDTHQDRDARGQAGVRRRAAGVRRAWTGAPRATRRRMRATPGRLRVASGFSTTSKGSSPLMQNPGSAGVCRGMLGWVA